MKQLLTDTVNLQTILVRFVMTFLILFAALMALLIKTYVN